MRLRIFTSSAGVSFAPFEDQEIYRLYSAPAKACRP